MSKQHEPKDAGPNSAAQSGDHQRIPDTAEANSESAKELVEERQFFEANAVDAVEDTVRIRFPRSIPVSFRNMTYLPSISTRTELSSQIRKGESYATISK